MIIHTALPCAAICARCISRKEILMRLLLAQKTQGFPFSPLRNMSDIYAYVSVKRKRKLPMHTQKSGGGKLPYADLPSLGTRNQEDFDNLNLKDTRIQRWIDYILFLGWFGEFLPLFLLFRYSEGEKEIFITPNRGVCVCRRWQNGPLYPTTPLDIKKLLPPLSLCNISLQMRGKNLFPLDGSLHESRQKQTELRKNPSCDWHFGLFLPKCSQFLLNFCFSGGKHGRSDIPFSLSAAIIIAERERDPACRKIFRLFFFFSFFSVYIMRLEYSTRRRKKGRETVCSIGRFLFCFSPRGGTERVLSLLRKR